MISIQSCTSYNIDDLVCSFHQMDVFFINLLVKHSSTVLHIITYQQEVHMTINPEMATVEPFTSITRPGFVPTINLYIRSVNSFSIPLPTYVSTTKD